MRALFGFPLYFPLFYFIDSISTFYKLFGNSVYNMYKLKQTINMEKKKTTKIMFAKRKLSQEVADISRERFLEGESIHSLAKRYDVTRRSIKMILIGRSYNTMGQWGNLLESKSIHKLF